MRVANAFTTLLIVGILPPSVPLILFWCCSSRVGLCGFSFLRVSAQCWLVDEDCYATGYRREGTIFGALAMVRNASAAFFSSIAFFGLGIAGLRTENCEARCRSLIEQGEVLQSGLAACIDRCFQQVVSGQPASLRNYCVAVVAFAAPLCELMLAFHAHSFPIKGVRLRRLYNIVAMKQDAEGAPPLKVQAQAGDATPAAHKPSSQISLFVPQSSRASLTGRLAATVAMVDSWPGSKSIAVVLDTVTLEPDGRKRTTCCSYDPSQVAAVGFFSPKSCHGAVADEASPCGSPPRSPATGLCASVVASGEASAQGSTASAISLPRVVVLGKAGSEANTQVRHRSGSTHSRGDVAGAREVDAGESSRKQCSAHEVVSC